MNLKGRRQSSNIIDRTQSSSDTAPHSNPIAGAIARLNGMANQDNTIEMSAKAKAMGKKNPLYSALKSMDKGIIQDHQAKRKARKMGQDPSIPIPTPRPDPTAPQPKVLRYNNDKG